MEKIMPKFKIRIIYLDKFSKIKIMKYTVDIFTFFILSLALFEHFRFRTFSFNFVFYFLVLYLYICIYYKYIIY